MRGVPLSLIERHVDRPGINPASGGHLGYIPGGGLYPSALGDFLADVTNRYAGVFFAYFVVFPLMFQFFAATTPAGVTMMTDITQYLDFVLILFFCFGLAFEIPIAVVLLTQTGQRTKDFQGRLQFIVNLQQDGKKSVMTLPAEDDKDARGFKLNFRFYQRVEGTFRVTPGTVVKGMQVRVLEGDGKEPRLTQQANLS